MASFDHAYSEDAHASESKEFSMDESWHSSDEIVATRNREAEIKFRAQSHPKPYTSPKALRAFLQLDFFDISQGIDCSNHEMLLVKEQTHTSSNERFVSTVCARCRYHFHFRSHTKFASESMSEHPFHMLILHEEKKSNILQHERQNRYDDRKVWSHFLCAVRACHYGIDISVMPPKLSDNEVDMLLDEHRVSQNLNAARQEDPDRYSDVPDDYGFPSSNGAPWTLARYLTDALALSADDEALRIKKRNKRFKVVFSTDFDVLLRTLGFEEKDDDTADACWFIGIPESKEPSAPTPIQTLRARMEDARAEIRAVIKDQTVPAWESLVNVFEGSYGSFGRPTRLSSVSPPPESPLQLLGCLPDYDPAVYSWAAITLAEIDPARREDYIRAGFDCVQNSSEMAQSDLVMYSSKFDDIKPGKVDEEVHSAYKFFGASPYGDCSAEYFVNQYYTVTADCMPDDPKIQQARHWLTVVERHTGFTLTAIVLPDLVTEVSPNKGEMSYSEAVALLRIESSWPASLVRECIWNKAGQVNQRTLLEACSVAEREMRLKGREDVADVIGRVVSYLQNEQKGDIEIPDGNTSTPTAPPGLLNIGNTCYLNSLLQYFYNVKVVRELVINFESVKLPLDEDPVANRRTGGNGTTVSLEEAIVARQFIQMLQALFLELSSTPRSSARPSQKLANTALSSAKEILNKTDTKVPPPLPARPSPAPPLSPKDGGVNVSVTPLEDNEDGVSTRSSQTLVGENELSETHDAQMLDKPTTSSSLDKAADPQSADGDIAMGNTNQENETKALTLDEKIDQVSKRLEHSDRTGTSQQDVEEIIGNILEHLMRAIRPDGQMLGRTDLQADAITENFFTTIVNFTVRAAENESKQRSGSTQEDIVNQEVVPERWITAFPHPDKVEKPSTTLYEALDRYFSYELIPDGKLARYTAIRALPPILHICIQRTDASGVKNKNPVVIPEELYLDRYMEAEPGSDLWKLRRRSWAVKERINQLEERAKKDKIEEKAQTQRPGDVMTGKSADDPDTIGVFPPGPDPKVLVDLAPRLGKRKSWAISDHAVEEPTGSSRNSNMESTSSDEGFEAGWSQMESLQKSKDQTAAELTAAREIVKDAFRELTKEKYRLHAVICHGGGMSSGHYWVWIRDFKKNLWVKYNDERVTEDDRESEEVLAVLNSGSDPYYVAYVRDERKDELVEVPQRSMPADTTPNLVAPDVPMEIIEGVETKSGQDIERKQN